MPQVQLSERDRNLFRYSLLVRAKRAFPRAHPDQLVLLVDLTLSQFLEVYQESATIDEAMDRIEEACDRLEAVQAELIGIERSSFGRAEDVEGFYVALTEIFPL